MSLGVAYRYASLGLAVFPLAPRSKLPLIPKREGGHGCHDATVERTQIETWWGKSPAANVGVAMGPVSGCWALDVDPETSGVGVEWLAAKETEHGSLPKTPESKTLKGGRHILFKWNDAYVIRNRAGIVEGLDARGDGGYIVAPPSFVSEQKHGRIWEGKYEWLEGLKPSEIEIAEAPVWLLDEVRQKQLVGPQVEFIPRERREDDGFRYGHKALDDECQNIISAVYGTQDQTLMRSASKIGMLVGGGEIPRQDAEDALINAAMAVPGQSKKHSVLMDKITRALNHGSETPRQAPPRAERGRPQLRVVGGNAREKIDPETGEVLEEDTRPLEHQPWAQGLIWSLTDTGKLKPTSIANIVKMLENHPGFLDRLALNRFSYEVWIRGALPCDDGELEEREWGDNEDVAVAAWMNSEGLTPSVNTVRQVATLIASRHSFDPVEDYLTSLEWDGKPRIDNWLTYYAGVEGNPYSRTVGPRFMISAVARVLEPGCKVDTMLVLEGPQGLLKSTLARALFGGEWFTDQIGDVTSKESAIQIQGLWCIEVAEMDQFSRADDRAVKSFLSRREDHYRPPYGRGSIKRPRRCVFIGTINPEGSGWLKDATGGRRYWPVLATEIDIEAVMRDRDQLWAEAVKRYRDNEQWWLNPSEERDAKKEQSARQTEDLWDRKIAEWLRTARDPFTNSDVVEQALVLSMDKREPRVEKRIGSILTRMECVPVRPRGEDGKQYRAWLKPKREDEG